MLTFTCEHCLETTDYNKQTIQQFNRDTVDVKGHVVCKDCGELYKDINVQVMKFADAKREELEADFFNKKAKSKKQKDSDEVLEQADKALDDLLK